MIERLEDRGDFGELRDSMPMKEIQYIRGLYFFSLISEIFISYWPFVGYTTRPHGLLMAGLGHCVSGKGSTNMSELD